MHKFVHALTGLVLVAALMRAEKPSKAEAAALIEKSRQKSLAYARSLPDFVCTEVISRYRLGSEASSRPVPQGVSAINDPVPDWVFLDKLTVNLSYFQQDETHELKLLNGKPTGETFDSLGAGVVSTGEFGGILRSIFDPDSQTSFRWESWKNVRRRPVGVYAYHVEESNSRYYVKSGEPGNVHQAIVGFHGTIEIDRETGEVIHLDHIADHIPSELHMSRAVTEVDYDFMDVAGKRYLLPVHSQTHMDGKASLKNDSTFRDYRKFDVGSKVDFGVDK
jgi:hypothetical protein